MKKGFTILELIISLAIASILILIITRMFFYEFKNYKKFIIQDRNESYAKEALRFIETQVENIINKDIEIEGKKLTIKKNNGDVSIIEKKTNSNKKHKIIINYYKHINSTWKPDTIVENVQDFSIYRNKNVIYVTIETENGVKFERCIEIKEIKKGL
ncbi:prepilin-type N-terminal cleavage/methylation domain-containing protein [Clostridium sp. ZS2-4]|uniref:prepilin-type N-terminal cleavage/methylation domain-containing protein n=1 Tax=Clostridium sp. ZS2-4 TaxID=2987703 RepID=UPI00227AD4CC|nr:prepilin-type N-terminal cleavage/methylation domain-containing protein [Clostridium sp. ZS2-4]MCY6354060.1 prepilin-type N-terminal cleavage/methylation domain-containing protein [Clostridium sp. ZS2-4]